MRQAILHYMLYCVFHLAAVKGEGKPGREGGREDGGRAWLSSRQHCNNEPASAIFKTYHQYTTGSSRLLNINPVATGGRLRRARVVLRRPPVLDHPIKDVLGG